MVLDLDGVIFLGATSIPGVGETLHRLRDVGWRIIFATNNGTRSRQDIETRIADQTGFAPDPEFIITSAMAAAGFVGSDGEPVFLVGEAGLRATFEAAGVRLTDDAHVAASVVVALDRAFDYAKLEVASTAIRDGARFIATNTDLTFPTPTGQVPGADALVAAIGAAAGVEPVIAGKPHAPMVQAVRAVLGPGETWMIGDRPETDLAFAKAGGWKSVLTLSGITSDPTTVPAQWTPDLVVAALPALLDQ